ncbi:MAG: DUF1501 domain-containing protein [Candidatus Methylacidiphilales bacterium]
MTRRYFLQSSGALALYCGVTPFELLAAADPLLPVVKRHKTLVVVFLRGGMDGLNFVVPFGDAAYYQLRKGLALARPGEEGGVLALTDYFGLHPRAASLAPLFKSGLATSIQAVGYAHNTRSHFEEQDVWETGVVGNTVNSDGWLNRHLLTSEGRGTVRAVSFGDNLPRILRGKASAVAVRGLQDLSLPAKDSNQEMQLAAALEHAFAPGGHTLEKEALDLLAKTGGATLDGVAQLRDLVSGTYEPKAVYPDNGFAKKLREAARLIKADVGVEVMGIDYGGWDTHSNQGALTGSYGNMMQTLSDGLAAFTQDMDGYMDDVLVLTLTDFGRTAAENGTGGTDHGWANCMLAVGGPVMRANQNAARPVIGSWPGLDRESLHEKRDLAHTTDFRDVLGEVVSVHLGNPNLKSILPSHDFKPVGLVVG